MILAKMRLQREQVLPAGGETELNFQHIRGLLDIQVKYQFGNCRNILEFGNKIRARSINLGVTSLHMECIVMRMDEINYGVSVGRENLEA